MRVGKTTAADHLVAEHGFVKLALADPIKEIARRDFGWGGAKDVRGRRLLQEIGDVGRNYDPDVWLERLAARIAAGGAPRVAVDDVRLEREVELLRDLGFTVALVTRSPGLVTGLPPDASRLDHATETGLENARLDLVIANDGTFEELYEQLDRLVDRLTEEGGSGGQKPEGPARSGALGD